MSYSRPKRELAVAALLAGRNIRESAAQCGIPESTLHRWLRESGFQSAYRQAKKELLEGVKAQVLSSTASAVASLREVSEDQEAPPAARVAASRTLLELALKLDEQEPFRSDLPSTDSVPLIYRAERTTTRVERVGGCEASVKTSHARPPASVPDIEILQY